MKNNNNNPNIRTEESWASTISDYILQRRAQTYSAYVQPVDANDSVSLVETDSYLFKALFVLLAKQLEEGHTVLTLRQDNSELPLQGRVEDKIATLYSWQRDILQSLAAPLFDLMDNSLLATVLAQEQDDQGDIVPLLELENNEPIFNLLHILITHGTQLWLQSSLSNSNKAQLVKRFKLVKQLYDLMQNVNKTDAINQNEDQLENSLSRFVQHIAKQPLFTNLTLSPLTSKNSLSKKQPISKPIQTQAPLIYLFNPTSHNSEVTFWLHRTWQAEFNLSKTIQNILNQPIEPLDINIPDNLNPQQVQAVKVANENAFSIITGGPGTGKTYTVAQLVIALQQAQADSEAKQALGEGAAIRFSTDSAGLALSAPTGKAAQRMQESLQAALDSAQVEVQLQEAKTIHRLLGIGRDGRPRYHADNPLGEDIVIVDEASMLGVELANYLVSAIKPGARLILLGDANQLAAVDAGAVLADLCRIDVLQPIHAQLTESRRFHADSGIGKLATEINKTPADMNQVWQLLNNDESLQFQTVDNQSSSAAESTDTALSNLKLENSLSNKKILFQLSQSYTPYLNKINSLLLNPIAKSVPAEVSHTVAELMTEFNKFRILTAGHNGEWGDHNINDYLTRWHIAELKLPLGKSPWFHGRPVMVLQNNYELDLFNGDIGICLQTQQKGEGSRLEVFFENKTQGIAVNLLNDELIATAYAMTIHKSQGSEFDHVAITFDNRNSRLLSKELIYTAVTRAKQKVTIYSTKQALQKAVQTPTQRYTGLALQFEQQ
ncbi:exodeoxyribonuclease V subunit alpha [Psychrobacter phenylpyruvicus]|uniref:RecBCD enzyme subunit RecD n=1 Tax=Psychrobacter phenylpyruvicus TaxID=29432 RepID=A0A379LJP4_9GAMM|nr:exodeoxyribonuclease V subunit alpha [Psychrobacter phenylpyruvicus]SUD90768.1 Exodeoxyribonuclease V alpha chain [Psychrobacter phenylpyruvicus]